jgi:hypothetical protein
MLFLSCVSQSFAKIDLAVGGGDYRTGIALLEENRDAFYSAQDRVLYYLDKGMLSHYAANYGDSIEALQAGEQAIAVAFTKSISMEIGTYLINDTVQEYPGEDYEDIYIKVFNALNYYYQGKLEDALVEIRGMNNKLRDLTVKYGVLFDNMQKKALEEGASIPVNTTASVKFANSALARYLGMLFYRGTGNLSDARIDSDQIRYAFADAPLLYNYPLPSSLEDELDIPKGTARLNVIAFAGLAPIKEEQVIRIPLPNDTYIKVALPEMVARPSAVSRIAVVFDGGTTFSLELLENIAAIASETFKTKKTLAYTKAIIRGTLKGVTASALSGAADKSSNAKTSLLLNIFSLGAQIAAETSEKADTRISRYFPAKAYVGGITLDPGVYSFTIYYYNEYGKIIESFYHKDISVRENTLNLTEAVCLK